MGCHAPLQGIFPAQGSSLSLMPLLPLSHCRSPLDQAYPTAKILLTQHNFYLIDFFFHFLTVPLTFLSSVVQFRVIIKIPHFQSISFTLLPWMAALQAGRVFPSAVSNLHGSSWTWLVENHTCCHLGIPPTSLSQISHGHDCLVNLLSSTLHGFLFSQMAVS